MRKPTSALLLVIGIFTLGHAVGCGDSSSRGSGSGNHGAAGKGGTAGSGTSGSSGNVGTGGSSAASGSGSGGTTGGGSGASATGGSGGGSAGYTIGDVIEFVPGEGDVPYALGENPYGLRGGAFLARAPNGNDITVADEPGKICITGSLQEVPNGDYTGYWGVEVGFNLNQVPAMGGEAGAAGAAGAASGGAAGEGGAGGVSGSDGSAGAPLDMAAPWSPGKVVGFSYVIEGAKIGPIRFKSLPSGLDPTLESSVYCKPLMTTSGVADDSLFSQMRQYCWDTSSTATVPLDSGLANISWQLPADVNTGVREFDWCVYDLRPLLMP
jgi:hypothetical protein